MDSRRGELARVEEDQAGQGVRRERHLAERLEGNVERSETKGDARTTHDEKQQEHPGDKRLEPERTRPGIVLQAGK